MLELRKDYFFDKWTIIATERAKRPHQFRIKKEKPKPVRCPFCPGNEHQTLPETAVLEEKGKWIARIVPNKFPAVSLGLIPAKKGFLEKEKAFGMHEVVIETRNHRKQMADFKPRYLAKVLKMAAERIKELKAKKGINYVTLFKNKGKEAGCSLEHSHLQMVALGRIPQKIKEELKAVNKKKGLLYITKLEGKSQRFIKENKEFAAFCPFAPYFLFESWIVAKNKKFVFENATEKELEPLSSLLIFLLKKLKKLNAPYNIVFGLAPESRKTHFFVKVLPQLSTIAGFEYATNIRILSVSPEDAAEYYRSG